MKAAITAPTTSRNRPRRPMASLPPTRRARWLSYLAAHPIARLRQQDIPDELDPGVGERQQEIGCQHETRGTAPPEPRAPVEPEQHADDDEGQKREQGLVIE